MIKQIASGVRPVVKQLFGVIEVSWKTSHSRPHFGQCGIQLSSLNHVFRDKIEHFLSHVRNNQSSIIAFKQRQRDAAKNNVLTNQISAGMNLVDERGRSMTTSKYLPCVSIGSDKFIIVKTCDAA